MDVLQKQGLRKIIHIDMDCFYAAVEIRDQPQLQGKPVAVGGSANQRGVLSTCNYEARRYGLHSAMSTVRAKQLCPHLILLPVRMRCYKEISHRIRKIFMQYTDCIEPLSLDEAYLDVSDCEQHQGSATWIAKAIRDCIEQQEGLTASAGIAPNKLLAKIASDWNKPNGQYVIRPEGIDVFMRTLAIEKIHGIGAVTAKKLHRLSIKTCGDLQGLERSKLVSLLGKWGYNLYDRCRGIDTRPLQPHRQRKSVSVEKTFTQDLKDLSACLAQLKPLYEKLQQRLQAHRERRIAKLFVKLKFYDFSHTTVECTTSLLTRERFRELLLVAYERKASPVRLIGLGLRFDDCDGEQGLLLPLG